MRHTVIMFKTILPENTDILHIKYNWEHSIYGNVKEELQNNTPNVLGKPIILTHDVDANFYHDLLTGRSVTGILHFINQTPIPLWSKKQLAAVTATYSSFVAARTCV